MHPRDADVYQPGTIVRLKKTGQFVRIIKPVFVKDGKGFLHYLGEIEEREGQYAIYHQDVELEVLPPDS